MILNVIQWSVSSHPLKLVLLHVIKNPTDRAGQKLGQSELFLVWLFCHHQLSLKVIKIIQRKMRNSEKAHKPGSGRGGEGVVGRGKMENRVKFVPAL